MNFRTGNWWEEGIPGHDRVRAMELIVLMRMLVEQVESCGAFEIVPDAGIHEFVCADSNTRLQRLGENFHVEVSSETPPEIIYVLLGKDFLVQIFCSRVIERGDVTFSLDLVEGYEQARLWLLAYAAGPTLSSGTVH